MMKLFDDSPLQIPIRILMAVFSFLRAYYNGVANSPDAYEHFYVGFIATTAAAYFQLLGWMAWPFAVGIWVWHFLIKEVCVDGWKKHWLKKYVRKMFVGQGEMRSFAADTITRNAGFLFASPFLIFAMLRG